MSTREPDRDLRDPNESMRDLLDKASDVIEEPESHAPFESLRRSGPVASEGTPSITLIEDEFGILRWRIGDPVPAVTALGGRRMIQPNVEGEVIWEKEIQGLGANTVIGMIQALDEKLNPNQGLRALKAGKPEKADEKLISEKGPILVLVHGTFSKTEAFLEELNSIQEGRDYLSWATNNYAQILAFDHATISTNPFLNALALTRILNQTTAEVDVICHSRGGLVTRWWLEMLDRPDRKRRRAVVVGATLQGTSLAAPDRVRKGFEHLSNMVRAVGTVASAIPFTAGISGLISVAASCVGAVAQTPAIDALFAMVPGLAAMSHIQNNSELNQLQALRGNSVDYFGVKSNFEPPPEVKIWQFWKAFNRPLDRFKNALADDFIFRDERGNAVQNDLVVDCKAMMGIPPCEVKEWCDFGNSPKVHHTNYFEQPETIKFIRAKLS
jgi:hypothetical protein